MNFWILVRIRIRILLFSSVTFKTLTKNFVSLTFLFVGLLYILKVNLHHFSKIKSHNIVTKERNRWFSFYFCLIKEGAGSGSVSLNNGSGCWSGSATLIQTYRFQNISSQNYRLIGCILTVSLHSLPDSLVLLERLRWLDLSNNYLKSLPARLDSLRQLAKLNLSFNQLTQLPIALGNIHTLKGIWYGRYLTSPTPFCGGTHNPKT